MFQTGNDQIRIRLLRQRLTETLLVERGQISAAEDMEQLELAGPVDAVISVCDTMNYVLEETAMGRVFSRVYRFLKPGGYFIFDLKTVYCYRNDIGSREYSEQDEDVRYIRDNYYDEH